MNAIRFIFFSDSHLGYDYPFRPRVERRRRGDDFFRNFDIVLERAIEEKVDFLIHGGDLFYRSKIPEKLVWMVFQRIFKVADKGIPVFIVPGNHERSNIPHGLFALHEHVHIFEEPGSIVLNVRGNNVMISGFPNDRDHVRTNFPNLVDATCWQHQEADLRLLCIHQAVDGSRIENFTFRGRDDVVNPRDIPRKFDAVLAGHIHKWQKLEGSPPVFYPGSLERTSFIERFEEKGYFDFTWQGGALRHQFVELPARPMFVLEYDAELEDADTIVRKLHRDLLKLPRDAVVRITISGEMNPALIRGTIPDTMNATLRFPQMQRNQKENIAKPW